MRSSAVAGRSTPQRALSRSSPELPPCTWAMPSLWPAEAHSRHGTVRQSPLPKLEDVQLANLRVKLRAIRLRVIVVG